MLRGGTLIGTVGVSGLPDLEDHLLVTNALRELLIVENCVGSGQDPCRSPTQIGA
jgi:uncharacterized protein (UPF0303 family)